MGAAIRVDGVLDESAWASAWHYELGYEVDPGENTPAPVRTEVLVMHGEKHLYVGFRAHDPDPRQIRAHLSDRDQAWTDDWVGIVLDTFNDERRDYLLVINPRGVQMDNIEAWPNGGTVWDGRGFDLLLTGDPDRLARSLALQVLIIEELERCGIRTIFLDGVWAGAALASARNYDSSRLPQAGEANQNEIGAVTTTARAAGQWVLPRGLSVVGVFLDARARRRMWLYGKGRRP